MMGSVRALAQYATSTETERLRGCRHRHRCCCNVQANRLDPTVDRNFLALKLIFNYP